MHQYTIAQANIAVGATPKTVLQVATPSTRRAKWLEIGLGFRSVTASDGPALVEILRQTNAGTGTAITPQPLIEGDPAALSAAKHTMTVEPTGGTVLKHFEVPVQGGQIMYQIPEGDEIGMSVSSYLGVRITTPQNQNVDAYVKFQE